MGLAEYKRKRDFKKTAEPAGQEKKSGSNKGGMFVIQKHDASRLHYDFRLEMDGVLKSWAVPKGPSMNPKDKRLAVQVEDHPIDYATFEGVIPEGQYGGGTVMLWDRGEWEPLEGNAHKEWASGSMKFRLEGERLKGTWALVRMNGGRYGDSDKNWLLIKERDDEATTDSITEKYNTSVSTRRPMDEIAAGKKSRSKKEKGGMRVWKSNRAEEVEAPEIDLSDIDGARKSKFPHDMKPQLATLVKSAPAGGSWVHEIKFDGYRFLAFIKNGTVTLITRNGKDWTAKFSDVAEALSSISVETAILDGELVALDEKGVSRFQLLQNSLKGHANPALAFYVFDLVYLNGYSLKSSSLENRKALLRQLIEPMDASGILRFSEHFAESGETVWTNACRMGLEGIISKDLTAPYEERRSKSWVKVKCSNRQEFVIGGFTAPSGARSGFGALLVGFFDDDKKLRYAGKVGTGYTDASLKELYTMLKKIAVDDSPFENPPRGAWLRQVTWVKPELIGEIAFAEMTDEGLLRHSSFQGLREDKTASTVTIETPKAAPKSAAKKTKQKDSTSAKSKAMTEDEPEIKLTNPQRKLFPEENITKQDMADYYEAVKERAFPWLSNRPLTLVRCPEGRGKPCFYQRHTKETEIPGIAPVDISVKGGKETYFYLADPVGLRALVQSSTLELHGWQCKADDTEHPDRIIFDVDPSPEVTWTGVIKAAKKLKELLEKCGFETFPMSTGGKGLHVVVPLKPAAGWDEVIGFAEAIARFLESTDPDNYTANLSKKKRTGKVFVDYLRNGKTASAVLPYSSRARQGATVATPLKWTEVTDKLDPARFNIKTVPKRLKTQKQDPWAGYEKARKPLKYEDVIARLQKLIPINE